jgi:AraC-like DNA-binding protein
MLGSTLFGQQPTFRGADFGMPEIEQFGAYQFRRGIATVDSWEQHRGPELLFLRSGEACWELAGERLARANGGQALVFPAGVRHRIVNGIYPPGRAVWIVFASREQALAHPGLFPPREVEALFQIAERQEAPITLPGALNAGLGDLATRLGDERLLIGSVLEVADLRARLYATVVELWKLCASGQHPNVRSAVVRDAERLLAQNLTSELSVDELAHHLGYARSRIYALFRQEVGMGPNDYRQRLRIKRGCERLSRGDDSILRIAMDCGYASSQYFSRVFRKYAGVTPSTYRRLFGAGRPTELV